MTAFSFGARLHLGANSDLALSLPQSRLCILRARQLPPQREPRRLPPQSTEVISARTGEPRTHSVRLCGNTLSKCVCARRTLICFSCARRARFMRPKGALHAPKARFMCRRHASFAARMCCHSLVSSGSKREWRYRKSRQSGSENTAVHTACGAITV